MKRLKSFLTRLKTKLKVFSLLSVLLIFAGRSSPCYAESRYYVTESQLTELEQIIRTQKNQLTQLEVELTNLKNQLTEQSKLLMEYDRNKKLNSIKVGAVCVSVGLGLGLVTGLVIGLRN